MLVPEFRMVAYTRGVKDFLVSRTATTASARQYPSPAGRGWVTQGWQSGVPALVSGKGVGCCPGPSPPRPAPSPSASKDLQVPWGLSMPSFMNCTEVLGLSKMLMPPTRAAGHSPLRMAWQALCRASRLEEQAESREMLGPAAKGTEQKCESLGVPPAFPGEGRTNLEGGLRHRSDDRTHAPQRAPTFKVEEEGEAVGHHGSLAAHHAVAHECFRVSAQSLGGLRATYAHPDAGVCPPERGWVDAYGKQLSDHWVAPCLPPSRGE